MKAVLTVATVLALASSLPANAATKSNSATVDRDFSRLSHDGQVAFADIAQAQTALAAGQTTQALPLIQDAESRLAHAATDHKAFVKAETELPSAAGAPQHGVRHTPSATPDTWIPVSGSYVVADDLAPDKQQAVQNANQHLTQGRKPLVVQDLKIVGIDVDYIIGLAPLQQASGDVPRFRFS